MKAPRSAVERRACNSPIQGTSSDFCSVATRLFMFHYEKALTDLGMWDKTALRTLGGTSAVVHDAIILSAIPYRNYLVAMHVLQWCATLGAMEYFKVHYGLKWKTYIEVELDLGFDESTLESWDWYEGSLAPIIRSALEIQKKQCNVEMDIDACFAEIMQPYSNSASKKYLLKNYPILGEFPSAERATKDHALAVIQKAMK